MQGDFWEIFLEGGHLMRQETGNTVLSTITILPFENCNSLRFGCLTVNQFPFMVYIKSIVD